MYLINQLVEFIPESKTLVNRITGRTIQLQIPASLCFLYLVTHPGEIVSQNQLMKVGWGERNDVTTPNTFYQAILTLRNALAEAGLPRDTVKTISRRGLMLSESTLIERFTPEMASDILPVDLTTAGNIPVQKKTVPGWLMMATATLFLIALVNSAVLYKFRLTTPFNNYMPLSLGGHAATACSLFYAPNERFQNYYLRLLEENPRLCAEERYVFLTGYSKTERMTAFVCNTDARNDAEAFCTAHYFWAYKQ